jgi:transposase
MNQNQQKVIDEWINTSNYVYNKTLEKIKSGLKPNFMNLRDLLVTNNTKKNTSVYTDFNESITLLKLKRKQAETQIEKDNISENIKKINQDRRDAVKKVKGCKNEEVNEWELYTPKEVRACAVKEVCSAYKSGFSNLKHGTIKHFNLEYRKKTKQNKCVNIPSCFVSLELINNKEYIRLAPTFFETNDCLFLINKRKKNKTFTIEHDCKIVKQKNKYWLIVPIDLKIKEKTKPKNYCGVDPGVRTFLTTFGNNNSCEYKHNKDLLNKLNNKIIMMKNRVNVYFGTKYGNYKKSRIRKKAYTKCDEKKINIVNELHWKSINDLLLHNDVILYGDIKSHDIVRTSTNKHLKRSFNDLKFYKYKTRLLYKASVENKIVLPINETYTTQTCSFCGHIYKPECSKVYNCVNCNKKIDRDMNASKNILMKGIISSL